MDISPLYRVDSLCNKLLASFCRQKGIDVLIKKAIDKLSQVTALCFHGHNCAADKLQAVDRLMHVLANKSLRQTKEAATCCSQSVLVLGIQ